MNTEAITRYVRLGLTESQEMALKLLADTTGRTEQAVLMDAVLNRLAEAPKTTKVQQIEDDVWSKTLRTWHQQFGTTAMKPSEVLTNREMRLKVPYDEVTRSLPTSRKFASWLSAHLGRDHGGYALTRVQNTRTRSWMYRVDKTPTS